MNSENREDFIKNFLKKYNEDIPKEFDTDVLDDILQGIYEDLFVGMPNDYMSDVMYFGIQMFIYGMSLEKQINEDLYERL